MPRPDYIPVCRIQCLPVPGNGSTHWRRALHRVYGPVTKDSRGRQQVPLATLEQALGRVFTEAEIGHALRTPSRHPTQDRRRDEQLRHLWPGEFQLPERFVGCGLPDAEDEFVRACVKIRDCQWVNYLRAIGAHI